MKNELINHQEKLNDKLDYVIENFIDLMVDNPFQVLPHFVDIQQLNRKIEGTLKIGKVKKYQDEMTDMIEYVFKHHMVNELNTTLSDLMLIRNINLTIQEEVK